MEGEWRNEETDMGIALGRPEERDMDWLKYEDRQG
jgi:hypothetical protein